MGEFEEKLNAFLSNPQAMAQVMSLAQSLNLSGEDSAQAPPVDSYQTDTPPTSSTANTNAFHHAGIDPEDLRGLGNLFSQIDPSLLQKLLPLVGELVDNGTNDQRMQLLYALQPFLKPERQDKVERAAKAAKLLHIGKKFLNNMGDNHV